MKLEEGTIVRIEHDGGRQVIYIFKNSDSIEMLDGAVTGDKWRVKAPSMEFGFWDIGAMDDNVLLHNTQNDHVWAIAKPEHLQPVLTIDVERLRTSETKWRDVVIALEQAMESLNKNCQYCRIYEDFYNSVAGAEECPLVDSCKACRSYPQDGTGGYFGCSEDIVRATDKAKAILDAIRKHIREVE